jgi:D-glycero-alpha-D-manno-heptose-7-phosphate kinase
MFAVATYFRAEGICIEIDSSSPPRSALGGSSAATVALANLFYRVSGESEEMPYSRAQVAMLSHALEASVAGVPCGLQDQLAAVYGGVNAWHWSGKSEGPVYRREIIFRDPVDDELEKHILLAYCGIPHESKNINSTWVKQFISGESRFTWAEIISSTKRFIDAFRIKDFSEAASAMNDETALRIKMTPEVFDTMGETLIHTAVEAKCGARFTGAGGGGCIWAVGEAQDISRLKPVWQTILEKRSEACLFNVKIDATGVICNI